MPRRAPRLDANQDVIVNVLCAEPDVSVFSLAGVAAGLLGSPRGDQGRDASRRGEGRGEAALASDLHAGTAAVDRPLARRAGRGAHGRRDGARLGAARDGDSLRMTRPDAIKTAVCDELEARRPELDAESSLSHLVVELVFREGHMKPRSVRMIKKTTRDLDSRR